MRSVEHVQRIGDMNSEHKIIVRKPELGSPVDSINTRLNC